MVKSKKIYKHALLMFSKPPIPGLVKTRLTRERGGIFSPEEAAELFHRSLFDVMELCIQAISELEAEDGATEEDGLTDEHGLADEDGLTDEHGLTDEDGLTDEHGLTDEDGLTDEQPVILHEYHFFISTTPEDNVQKMRETFEQAGTWPREFTYLTDKGNNFDEHFDDAFQQIFALGFDSVLSVGGDIPMLPKSHITTAFRWLQYFLESSEIGGLVQAPCQECGVSMIGWTRDTPIDHQGVYYNMTGRPALDAYVEKAAEKNVPFASLPPVADVDDVQDLAHAISLARAAAYGNRFQPDFYVPQRFLSYVNWCGIKVGTPPNEDRDSREGIDG